MRIAQVAPLSESVPPARYGGTERVVSYLTEELVRRGHDVTLFASGDSETAAQLVSVSEKALWRSDQYLLHDAYHMLLLEAVLKRADQFDIIHYHFDYWHLPFATRKGTPFITTLHGRLDLPDLIPVYETFPNVPFVSISDAQRIPLPWLNWQRTIHHGLPRDLYAPREAPGEYLAFIGRSSPEKGLPRAIEIAKEAGMKLKIAAAVQPANREYFEREIRPLLSDPLIEFVGEVGGKDKEAFLQNAYAVLFPIEWPEPFGLVMIESMACGTPVIAFPRGSVPEVIWDGVSGFIVENVAQAVEAVRRIPILNRRWVRRCFDDRFTVERMVDEYLDVYLRLVSDVPRPKSRRRLTGQRIRRSRRAPHPGPSLHVLPLPRDGAASPAVRDEPGSSDG